MYATVLQYLEDTAKRYPDKLAFADMEDAFTFKEIVQLSKRVGSIISENVKPGNPVIIYMNKRAYNIIGFFGAVYAGCFYVPVDSQMPVDRIELILRTLECNMILYDDVTEEKLGQFSSNAKKLNYREAVQKKTNESRLEEIRLSVKSTDLLYVLFTSGSTGVPKGVTISHLAVIDLMEWMCSSYGINENNILCNQAPFYFDASVPDLYIPIRTGAACYIPPKSFYTFPKKILAFIQSKEINTIIWVPSALCNVVNCKAFDVCIPTTIRLVIFCGEVMPCRHLNVWRRYVPDALYVNMYGPTEAVYACMYYNVGREFSDEDKLPLGKACENSSILLLDDNNQVVGSGKPGEICILGQCLSQGYYNAPDKTSTAFVQNPINNKYIELMYRTGDLAMISETGEMFFLGRKDFQVKRLGHRIELGEIESAILSVASIENACCVFNQETSDIVAFYTGAVETGDLLHKITEKLPQYMLPNKITKLENMPMNLNGKIDRPRLEKEFMEVQKNGKVIGNFEEN